MTTRWMLYGANGYTGKLMVEEAVRRGITPVLAGRREEAIRPIAERHGLDYRVFDLHDAGRVARELEGVAALALAAGPFSATSAVCVEACLRSGTHYTDITGEIAVFEACHARDADAKEAGISILPGVGFDVVPTDCLAATLAARMPDATKLRLAFAASATSKGTTLTMVEGLGKGGAVRRGGKILPVSAAHRSREVAFADKTRHCVTIPWGDVSTAYYSTGIGDIEVYLASPPVQARAIRAAGKLQPLLARETPQRVLKALVRRFVDGPSEQEAHRARAHVWARVENAEGRSLEGTLETPGGYHLTALTAVDATERCAQGETLPGALTPSMAFGADYVTRFEGVELLLRG